MSRKERKETKQEAKMAKKEAKQEKKVKQVVNEPAGTEKTPKKKRHIGRNILIVIIIIIIIGFVSCIASSGGDDDNTPDTSSSSTEDGITDEVAEQAAEYAEMVKTGYLYPYTTVEIQDVFEYNYPDGEWKYGTYSDSDDYLVEFTNDDTIQIQFKINEDEEEGDYDFIVTGFRNVSESEEDYTYSEALSVLRTMYNAYAEVNENTGIEYVEYDEDDSSVILGYFGPVEEYVPSEESDDSEDEENPTDEDAVSSEMTDEEIAAALSDTYDIDIDTMRERLYEGDLATYTEDVVAAMSNYECYVAYVTAAAEYDVATGAVDEEAPYPYITTPDEYVDWFRTAEVGDVIDIESAKIISIDPNTSIYCTLHEYGSGTNHTSAYFVVKLEDTSIYFDEDIVSMRVTYLGVNGGNNAVFECQTIGIQNY